ncbi:MAG: PAS domain S-box protein [Gammaproteobacteria bacterium]|nr:PAS domain S-box protein [Gammaproteobacteria bacterium]
MKPAPANMIAASSVATDPLKLPGAGDNARRIFDRAREMIYLRDSAGRFTFVNRTGVRWLGLGNEQLLGRSEVELFDGHAGVNYRSWGNDAQTLRSGSARQFEEMLTLRGRARHLLSIKLPVLDDSGGIGSLISIGIDVSRRKLMESALQNVALSITSVQGENVLRELVGYVCGSLRVDFALIGSVRDGVVDTLAVCDRGVVQEKFAYDLAGTPCEEVVGRQFSIHPDNLLHRYPGNALLRRFGFRSYAGIPLFDSAGAAIGILAVLHRRPMRQPQFVASLLKIYSVRAAAELERIRADAALREAEASYRAIFEAAEDPIFVHDWDSGAILDVNNKACEVYGFPRQELLRLSVGAISAGEPLYTDEQAMEWIERAKRDGAVAFDWHRRSADGSLRWDEVRLKSALIGGKPRVLAFTRDITERKLSEDALRASEEQYRSIFNASTDGLLLFARDGRVIDVNPAFAALVGCSVAEVMHSPPHAFVAPESGENLRKLMATVVSGDFFEAEGKVVHRDGHRIAVNVRGVPVVYRGDAHHLAIVRDISRHIEQQQQLVFSERRLRATVESSLDCILAIDRSGRIIEFNPMAEATFGIPAREAIGRNVSLLIPERFHAVHAAAMARVLGEGGGGVIGRRLEVVVRRADGSEFDAELVVSTADSAEGRIVIGFLRDMTEHRVAQAERERLEAQLRQAQKMEAIGHLAGGVAHDFNNLLTSLTGYVAMASERLALIGETRAGRYLQKSLQSAERARHLIQQLLVFSRGQRGEPVAVQLTRHLAEFVDLLRSTLPSSLDFQLEFEPDVPAVMVDPTQLDQVLMNLCINARDAMEGQGAMRVTVSRRQCRDGICASCQAAVAGDFVELAVADTGQGIAPAVLERVFDPFFTTKPQGKGTGMGLSTTHGIVHDGGGHILVESTVGKGSTFRVLLPVLDAAIARATPDARKSADRVAAPRLNGSVLVVDDDAHVLEFMEELLRDWGLDVRALRDPQAALAGVASGEISFDWAILDQTMPGMSGLELSRRLCDVLPDPRILLYTGYSNQLSEVAVAESGVRELLHKPLDHARLLRLLSDTLAR